RLLSPADRAALAGLCVELSSAGPEQQDCHRDECGEARLQAACNEPRRIPCGRELVPGRSPLGKVPRGDRADHRRELMAVASGLEAEQAEGRVQEQTERTDPPASFPPVQIERSTPLFP